MYVYRMLDTKENKHMPCKYFAFVMASIMTVILMVNLFGNFLYYIDANNAYVRGRYHFISSIYFITVLLVDGIILLANIKQLTRREIVVFSTYILLPIVAILFQAFFMQISFIVIANLLGVLILILNNQTITNEKMIQDEKLVNESKIKLIQMHQQIMLSQIQPHFIYNSLSAISYLIKDKPVEAQESLDKFIDYLRFNLDSLSNNKYVLFSQELEHIKTYVDLEKIRFEERLQVEYEIENADFLLPPLTIQPLVENAIRNGICKKIEGGTVKIKASKRNNEHIIIIEDDGVGFDINKVEEFEKDSRTHIGLKNSRERLESLSDAKFKIDSTIGKGTTIEIRIPVSKGE